MKYTMKASRYLLQSYHQILHSSGNKQHCVPLVYRYTFRSFGLSHKSGVVLSPASFNVHWCRPGSSSNLIIKTNCQVFKSYLCTDDRSDVVAEDEEYGEFVREICAIPGVGHRVLVVQPDIKTGTRRYVMTTRELKLEETCALVNTLPNWKVLEKRIVRTDHENTAQVFGAGNFELLVEAIRKNSSISAVVVGIDRLTGLQIGCLQEAWGLPVFDRYTIVLQIFKHHAQSPEAKLQVALAEIPYVRSRIQLMHGGYEMELSHLAGGSTQMTLEKRHMLLQRREHRIKRELDKLHSKRQEIRLKRQRDSQPTVAVVGYTNSGKTTLIKALTKDESLTPQNNLFATLDVSAHVGMLSSRVKVTYIDTVGFISDMPITLLDAFRATLEDAMMADLIVHVRDASHPDLKLQVVSVHKTLQRMLPEGKLNSMIEVYNKVDLIPTQAAEALDPGILQISAVRGNGLAELGEQLGQRLLQETNLMQKTFRIPNSENILRWLYSEAAVSSVRPDPRDGQFLIVDLVISPPAYGKFCARFARKKSQ
ncbi:putative GTP-binding protein 6 [Physella acuta]|uniref:putative GTP-binding protein 6 n=1 Tax=Physella acuta TaxID=109671 RepID=UPI0027DC3AFA|nr:putative GTP-binding protein 6 [Physella acuta]